MWALRLPSHTPTHGLAKPHSRAAPSAPRPLTVAADSVEEEADEAQLLALVHLVLEGLGGVQVRLCVALAGEDGTGSGQTVCRVVPRHLVLEPWGRPGPPWEDCGTSVTLMLTVAVECLGPRLAKQLQNIKAALAAEGLLLGSPTTSTYRWLALPPASSSSTALPPADASRRQGPAGFGQMGIHDGCGTSAQGLGPTRGQQGSPKGSGRMPRMQHACLECSTDAPA